MSTRKTQAEKPIRLTLICESAPTSPDVEFGLQDKSRELKPGVPEPDGSLRFDGEIRAVTQDDGTVRFRGPIVHGPPGKPFLYLSCRPAAERGAPWFRLKVPLDGVEAGEGSVEARVRASRGGTVAPMGRGWTSSADG